MLLSPTPVALLNQQAKVLRTELEGVYDGRLTRSTTRASRHDASASCSRSRRAHGRGRHRRSKDAYRDVGRALGRVRDIDVQIGLIRGLERHAPQTAPSLVVVRQDHERDRLAGMRRLIKTLERLDVEAVLRTDRHPTSVRTTAASWRRGPGARSCATVVRTRGSTAAERISHATGVYFPNRAHNSHIAIKNCAMRRRSARRQAPRTQGGDQGLRKGQEVLGAMHDREALSHTLAVYVDRDHVTADHIALTSQVLEGEILDLHARYMARRSAICDACAEIQRRSVRGSKARPALAVGGGILVAGLAYLNNRTSQANAPLMELKNRRAG